MNEDLATFAFGKEAAAWGAGYTVDVDDDGETTARVRGGVWASETGDTELAEYLNAVTARDLPGSTDDAAIFEHAKTILGI